jgi:ubiquinone/menaquinone biosynthesis C-methylase UbiE
MARKEKDDVLEFWNRQAGLGKWAGTRDLIAKQIEIEAISSYVSDGMEIFDFGCGNGITAFELARRYDVRITGMDYAEEMIRSAESLNDQLDLKGSVQFRVGDQLKLASLSKKFDMVYTERTLINLPDWQSQKKAIAALTALLKTGGVFVMCENSQDGLDKINAFRYSIGLMEIQPPWHNHYFRDADIASLYLPGVTLEKIDYYSSTYYFISRIINAWFASEEGREPDYDAPINHLALKLPPYGDIGQGRIWLWRRTG